MDELENFMPAMHDLTVKMDIIKRNNIRITEHCFYTDVEFVLKVFNSCSTLRYFELPIYYYRIAREGQSMSVSGVEKHYKDHEKMLFNMLDYYNKEVKREGIQEAIKERLVGVCKMQYSFYCIISSTSLHKKEFKNMDQRLKKYPYFYNQMGGSLIGFLRKNKFNGYWLVSKIKTYRDKKYGWNFFAG